MMGLLEILKSADPATKQGLLQFGLSLMSSKGGLSNALGQAGMQGMQGAQQFRQRKFQDQMQQMQLEQLQRQKTMQGREDHLASLPGQFIVPPSQPGMDATGGLETALEAPNNQASPQGRMDLGGLAQALMSAPGGFAQGLGLQQAIKRQAPQLHAYKPGDVVGTYENGAFQEVLKVPDKPEKPEKPPSSVQEYQFAVGQGYKGTFEQWDTASKKAGASSTSVSYGAPVAGLDPSGNPVFFQPGKDGGAPAIVPGVRPPQVVDKQLEQKAAKDKAAATAKLAHKTITQMLDHEGLNTAVGLGAEVDPRNYIGGTKAQGALSLIEQAQGQAFLQAFEALKGGGQITQIEGEKATAAIARLKRKQSVADFRAAADELREIANAAHKRATGEDLSSPVAPTATNPKTGKRLKFEGGKWVPM